MGRTCGLPMGSKKNQPENCYRPFLSRRGSSTIDTGATKFFETVYDASILQWVPALKKRLHALGFDMGANDVDGLGEPRSPVAS